MAGHLDTSSEYTAHRMNSDVDAKLPPTSRSPDLGRLTREPTASVPGLIAIFANHRPAMRIFRAERGLLTLGRMELSEGDHLDSAIAREHARISFDGAAWLVTDLGSRNGTFVNARATSGETRAPAGSIVRIGGTLLLAAPDILPFNRFGLGTKGGLVCGPSLGKELEAIAVSGGTGMIASLLIIGETGTGKELAAKAFHAGGPKPNGPFAAVNCATIPKELAERLLFGSIRGAFSGAIDAPGHVQAANGGTLFLDEVAELPADVQGKLLRMVETHEVLRLGATTCERVDVRVCAATWRDLRLEVGAGRFREDLYFRIAQAEVRLPPLRKRVDEVPWHVQEVLDDCGRQHPITATAAFIEACALRAWPGNVRELRAEVRRAASAAIAEGSAVLTADDLGPNAGQPIPRTAVPANSPAYPDDEVAVALLAADGNVVLAARRLGINRNKVRRWLERYHVGAARFKSTNKVGRS
jgi:Sigma-54 interaction domain/FHA domain